MKFLRHALAVSVVLGFVLSLSSVVRAEDPPAAQTTKAAKPAAKDLILKGDAKCTGCHDEADEPTGAATMLELNPQVLSIGKTRHGATADSRTPTCIDCHGESEKHLNHKGSDKPPKVDRSFRKNTTAAADARSDTCLTCHGKDSPRSHWVGSAHQTRDVSCNACHQVHAAKDKVRDKLTQPAVCFACHKEQRAQASKPSHHPILEGKVACSDCHNSHGSVGPKLMKHDSTNETCYSCHMEKRGPFVQNHEPVNDDCSTCHNPHGTTAERLLKVRTPFLCQTCHTPHGSTQPAVSTGPAPLSSVVGWWNGSVIAQGRGCLNCHTQIHGSNNPSGANPTPQRYFR